MDDKTLRLFGEKLHYLHMDGFIDEADLKAFAASCRLSLIDCRNEGKNFITIIFGVLFYDDLLSLSNNEISSILAYGGRSTRENSDLEKGIEIARYRNIHFALEEEYRELLVAFARKDNYPKIVYVINESIENGWIYGNSHDWQRNFKHLENLKNRYKRLVAVYKVCKRIGYINED